MAKVAVILAQGFEEIEALTVVDVLRRANISCDMVGFEEPGDRIAWHSGES